MALWLAPLAAGGLVILLVWRAMLAQTGGEPGAPLDDAWIHFQFARNLAAGDGFSFNPGEWTAGSTAPLWTVMLAGIGLFTDQFLLPAMALSGVFFLATLLLTTRLALDLTGNTLWAMVAGVATALTGRMAWASLSAMEVTAFTTLTLAALLTVRRRGLGPVAALLFALSGQLRPEGHLLFALAIAYEAAPVLKERTKLAGTARRLGIALATYALVAVPYTWLSLATTGRPLPNTFFAKSSRDVLYSVRTLRETLWLHGQDNWVAVLPLTLGVAGLWQRDRLSASWLVGLLLVTPAIVPFVWHHGRYTMPLLPLQMVAAVIGLKMVTDRVRKWKATASFAGALFLLAGAAWGLPRWASMFGSNAAEILAVDVAAGQWLARNTPPDALVAVDDIGAIGFLSERRILDLNGLVSPEAWPALVDPDRYTASLHLMATEGVDYLAIFPDWHPLLVSVPGLLIPETVFEAPSLTIIGAPETVVFRPNWPYLSQAEPEQPLDVRLGDSVVLLGYDGPEVDGNRLAVTLYWQSTAPLSERYKLFLHAIDADGDIVAQIDRQPRDGTTPTIRWQPGDIIPEPLILDRPADSGPLELVVGLYSEQTGARLPVDGSTTDAITLFTWP